MSCAVTHAKRAHKRQELLAATERELDKVVAATRREQRPLQGKDTIAVRADRALSQLQDLDLKVRPVYHCLEGRVRAHVFLCMLAYYVE